MAISWLLCVCVGVVDFWLLPMASASYVVVDRSSSTFGPDGPWYAWNASIGNPPQYVNLLFDHLRASSPLAPNCDPFRSSCPSRDAGFYVSSNSRTANPANKNQTRQINMAGDNNGFSGPVSVNATVMPVTDTLRVYSGGKAVTVPTCGIGTLTRAYVVPASPNEPRYPVTLGGLSIGSPYGRSTYKYTDPGFPKHDLIPTLYSSGRISSSSFSVTLGSPSVGIEPQLVLGGYDTNKILGPVLSQPVPNNLYFTVQLSDMGLVTEPGHSSPFENGFEGGFLRGAQGRLSNFQPAVALNDPYLALPEQTCEALAQHLPLKYSKELVLYIWDKKDPKYQKIFSSASSLYFDFQSSSHTSQKPVRIKVPFRLLNLTLTDPLVTGESLTYFPCRPVRHESDAVLGRTFLQAATLGVNWATSDQGPSAQSWMFLAQAPGPGKLAGSNKLVDVSPGQTAIFSYNSGDNSAFGQTWQKYWNAYSASGRNSPASPPSHHQGANSATSDGLSSGAKAGIGVGIAVAVLSIIILVLWLVSRRRKEKKQQALSEKPQYEIRGELHSESQRGLDSTMTSSPTLVPGDTMTSLFSERTELQNTPKQIHELPGEEIQPTELASPVLPQRFDSMKKS